MPSSYKAPPGSKAHARPRRGPGEPQAAGPRRGQGEAQAGPGRTRSGSPRHPPRPGRRPHRRWRAPTPQLRHSSNRPHGCAALSTLQMQENDLNKRPVRLDMQWHQALSRHMDVHVSVSHLRSSPVRGGVRERERIGKNMPKRQQLKLRDSNWMHNMTEEYTITKPCPRNTYIWFVRQRMSINAAANP